MVPCRNHTGRERLKHTSLLFPKLCSRKDFPPLGIESPLLGSDNLLERKPVRPIRSNRLTDFMLVVHSEDFDVGATVIRVCTAYSIDGELSSGDPVKMFSVWSGGVRGYGRKGPETLLQDTLEGLGVLVLEVGKSLRRNSWDSKPLLPSEIKPSHPDQKFDVVRSTVLAIVTAIVVPQINMCVDMVVELGPNLKVSTQRIVGQRNQVLHKCAD